MKKSVITLKEYQGFQRAYDFFNREFFAGSLSQVLVTLQRYANTRGYFSPERFHGRIDKAAVHELALNPDNFTDRTDEMYATTGGVEERGELFSRARRDQVGAAGISW
jgi:hypothetical protein